MDWLLGERRAIRARTAVWGAVHYLVHSFEPEGGGGQSALATIGAARFEGADGVEFHLGFGIDVFHIFYSFWKKS